MITKYLEQLTEQNYSKETVKRYASALKPFKEIEITKAAIDNYQNRITNLAAFTRRSNLTILKNYLNKYYPALVEEIVIPQCPKQLPQNIPSKTTVQAILNMPDTKTFAGIRDRCVLELFYSTGIRRAELINLQLDDINFKKLLIRINQGKRGKDRLIPIAASSLAWLQKYIKKVRLHQKPKSEHVFVTKTGAKFHGRLVNDILANYSGYSCHKYRHAFATHLLQNGMREVSLQRLLGHANVTTVQIYTRITINDLKQSYARAHKRDSWE